MWMLFFRIINSPNIRSNRSPALREFLFSKICKLKGQWYYWSDTKCCRFVVVMDLPSGIYNFWAKYSQFLSPIIQSCWCTWLLEKSNLKTGIIPKKFLKQNYWNELTLSCSKGNKEGKCVEFSPQFPCLSSFFFFFVTKPKCHLKLLNYNIKNK